MVPSLPSQVNEKYLKNKRYILHYHVCTLLGIIIVFTTLIAYIDRYTTLAPSLSCDKVENDSVSDLLLFIFFGQVCAFVGFGIIYGIKIISVFFHSYSHASNKVQQYMIYSTPIFMTIMEVIYFTRMITKKETIFCTNIYGLNTPLVPWVIWAITMILLAFTSLNINQETIRSFSSVVILSSICICVTCIFGIGISHSKTSTVILSIIGSISYLSMIVFCYRLKRPRQKSILPSTFDIYQNDLESKLA